MKPCIYRADIMEFLRRLNKAFAGPARIYLIGETSQVFEGWIERSARLEFCARFSADERPSFTAAIEQIQRELEVELSEEPPGEVIPLPEGAESRARRASQQPCYPTLDVLHFDPYSVAIRYIARGDEPDYHLVLNYISHSWVDTEEMDALLQALLPRFTMETIQQDPAEFRRKYKGLLQMSRAIRPGEIHRHTPA